MSTKYNNSRDVPTDTLVKRLDELSDAIAGGRDSQDREFTMRIPAECDRDADLVLAESSRRLGAADTELAAAKARIAELEAEYTTTIEASARQAKTIRDQQKRIAALEKAMESLVVGDGCLMEAAYKEGWSDAGSPYDWEHAESSWEESHGAGDARRAAALLKEKE